MKTPQGKDALQYLDRNSPLVLDDGAHSGKIRIFLEALFDRPEVARRHFRIVIDEMHDIDAEALTDFGRLVTLPR